MCYCRPNIRTPCCGTVECHRAAHLVQGSTCPWCRKPVGLRQRDIPALIELLRIRALALTGAEWERDATRNMMNEAAQRLEDLAEILRETLRTHSGGYNDESCDYPPCPKRNDENGVCNCGSRRMEQKDRYRAKYMNNFT